ncbi:LexA repressor [Posidoniimonas corsicana]|uniref:LexA repressor n=2 Tax=Posidoniimonas corsicana TaxID=1938618 RepID=A0A5C5V5N5_9BACT|nr:LexA repressor [Posidoniimonas corsicana]
MPTGPFLMPNSPLSRGQARILVALRRYITTHGYAPTLRELAARLGIRSPNGVLCHLKALERKGYLRRASHQARAITLHGAA